jgi:hypothetical protein
MDGDKKLSRWAGPLIGAGLGVWFGFQAPLHEGVADGVAPVSGGLVG